MRSSEIERVSCSGSTGLSSRPRACARNASAQRGPSSPTSSSGGVRWSWPTVSIPSSRSRAEVLGPTPHSFSTASGARNSASVPGATSTKPPGLRRSEATLAHNLLLATPTLTTSPASSSTRDLIWRAIASPSPKAAALPVTSRNASSRLIGSTSGVYDLKMPITCSLSWR